VTYLGELADDPYFRDLTELFRTRFEHELSSIPGAGPTSHRGGAIVAAAVRVVEGLIGRLQRDLMNERSALMAGLAESRLSAETVERQLDLAMRTVTDAQRHRRPGLIRSALFAIGGLLAGGAAEGIASGVSSSLVDGGTPATVNDFHVACFALDHALDEKGVYEVRIDPSEASPVGPGNDRSDEDDAVDDDAFDDDPYGVDPWLVSPADVPDSEIWRHAGFTPEQATDWTAFGFSAEEALRWLAYRLTPTEASMWVQVARDTEHVEIDPSIANDWEENDYGPDEAVRWIAFGLDAEEARWWIIEGFEPDDAVEWIDAGVDVDDAVEWRADGLTADSFRLKLFGSDDEAPP
jgi:hypothetical protein